MTQEITDIVERNFDNMFDELDELAWHGGEYNQYIEEDVLQALVDAGEELVWAYTDHILAWELAPKYVLQQQSATVYISR